MKIKISPALKDLSVIDYRNLVPLQGELKLLSESNYSRLLKSLKEFGFRFPFFAWHCKQEKKFYTIDGHGRNRVFIKENITDEKGKYEFPYIPVEAKNKQEAAKLLLAYSSQYQQITQEGFDAFTATFEIDDEWLKSSTFFDGLPAMNFEDDFVDLKQYDDSASKYINNTVRQIMLVYDNETHRIVLEKLKAIGEKYEIESDNAATVLKLIELYESN